MTKLNLFECPNCGEEIHMELSKPLPASKKHLVSKSDDTLKETQKEEISEENKKPEENFKSRKAKLQKQIKDLEKALKNSCNSEKLTNMPWHHRIPPAMNRSSGRMYSGENMWLLWRICKENNYSKNNWATIYQWGKMRAKVKKGEKSTLIKIFIPQKNFGQIELENKDYEHQEQDINGFFVRYYNIFNADQVEGWYENTNQTSIWENPEANPYDSIDKMLEKLGVKITHSGDRPEYKVKEDIIKMPYKASFSDSHERKGIDAYYSILLQELIHWTGHFSRCKRIGSNNLSGESGLAFEKMIAEIGGAMLSTYFHNHVEVRLENTRYLATWKKIINHDIKYLYYAQNQALSAITWIFQKSNILPIKIKEKPFYPLNKEQVAFLRSIVED